MLEELLAGREVVRHAVAELGELVLEEAEVVEAPQRDGLGGAVEHLVEVRRRGEREDDRGASRAGAAGPTPALGPAASGPDPRPTVQTPSANRTYAVGPPATRNLTVMRASLTSARISGSSRTTSSRLGSTAYRLRRARIESWLMALPSIQTPGVSCPHRRPPGERRPRGRDIAPAQGGPTLGERPSARTVTATTRAFGGAQGQLSRAAALRRRASRAASDLSGAWSRGARPSGAVALTSQIAAPMITALIVLAAAAAGGSASVEPDGPPSWPASPSR